MLELDSLVHSYGRSRVLSGVYLTVRPGEVVGVVGRNGCGKTTMLRAIYGSLRPDQMRLSIDGEHVRTPLLMGLVSYLPQQSYLPRSLTVRRALRISLPGMHADAIMARVPAVRSIVARRVRDLSGGERRTLEFAVAVCRPSRYVLLDEPFTEIEPIGRDAVRDLIRGEAARGKRGVIVTDHAYRDVLGVADRVVVLVDGIIRQAEGESDLTRWGYTP